MNAHRYRTWPHPLTETQASTLRALYGNLVSAPTKSAAHSDAESARMAAARTALRGKP